MGELAVNHESGALPGPHRQPSTSDSPANAAAGAWVPAELGAASGEPPVDNHGVGQLRLRTHAPRGPAGRKTRALGVRCGVRTFGITALSPMVFMNTRAWP